MVEEGERLARIHKNIVVKCPMIPEGLKATRILSDRGIRVNVTLVFSTAQAMLAAKAGASFISPFVGRLDDIGHDGMELIADIMEMLGHYTYKAEVLVASTRSPVHVIKAARMGAHVATCPFSVLQQLAKHPLTDSGLERFLADWKKAKR
jgi:transaldolase